MTSMCSRRLAVWAMVLFAVFGWATGPAAAQERVTQVYRWTDPSGREFVFAVFAEPFTRGTELFVYIVGSNGSLSAGVGVEGVDLSRWTPTMPPTGELAVSWRFDTPESVGPVLLVVNLFSDGGVDGIGLILPPGTLSQLGKLQQIQIGSGLIHPDRFLDAYDVFLPPEEQVDAFPDWPLAFELVGQEGSGPVAVTVRTTTTTTSTSTTTTTTTTTTVPTTTVATTAPAGTGGGGGAGGGGGGALPPWLIGVIGVILILLGAYFFVQKGWRFGRRYPTELGKYVVGLPPDEKRRVLREFKALPHQRRMEYVDYVRELLEYYRGGRAAPPEPPPTD